MHPPIQAITIDLDDTLWPVWPTIPHAEDRLRDWLQVHAPAALPSAQDRAQQRRWREQVHEQHPERLHDLGFLRTEQIRLMLAHVGAPTALAEAAFEVFLAARQQVRLFDDVAPAMAQLAARYPVVALSNGNADVHRVGIGHWFRDALSAHQVGVAKPHRRMFELAAERAGVPMHAVLHIGDDIELDVRAAQAHGMRAVWVNRGEQVWPQDLPAPDLQVRDLGAVCDWLQAQDEARG